MPDKKITFVDLKNVQSPEIVEPYETIANHIKQILERIDSIEVRINSIDGEICNINTYISHIGIDIFDLKYKL
jgi:hypothetical protein